MCSKMKFNTHTTSLVDIVVWGLLGCLILLPSLVFGQTDLAITDASLIRMEGSKAEYKVIVSNYGPKDLAISNDFPLVLTMYQRKSKAYQPKDKKLAIKSMNTDFVLKAGMDVEVFIIAPKLKNAENIYLMLEGKGNLEPLNENNFFPISIPVGTPTIDSIPVPSPKNTSTPIPLEDYDELLLLDEGPCADLVVDSIQILKSNKRKTIANITIRNIGQGKYNINGKANDIEDNMTWAAYLSGEQTLNRGDILTGGGVIEKVANPILEPGETFSFRARIETPKRTRHTAVLLIQVDSLQRLRECAESNNVKAIILR